MRSLALASILALAPVAVMAASLGVPLNQSVLVSLPAPAHNVFLGNPTVADVAMSDQRHVVVTGKTGGVSLSLKPNSDLAVIVNYLGGPEQTNDNTATAGPINGPQSRAATGCPVRNKPCQKCCGTHAARHPEISSPPAISGHSEYQSIQ